MKRLIFPAMLFLGYSTSTMAQEAAAAPRRQQVDAVKPIKTETPKTQELTVEQRSASTQSLTDQQTADLKSAVQSIDNKRKEISENSQLTAAQKETALQAVEVEREAMLQKLLGAEGYKKYQAEHHAEKKTKSPKSN